MIHDNDKIEALLITGVGSKSSMRRALKDYAEHMDDGSADFDQDVYTKSEDTIVRLEDRIAEIEQIMRLAHIGSRKHTPGYCTVRQSDIDAMGRVVFPHDDGNPPPPADLVGALQDRIHPASGKLIGSKPIDITKW